MLEYITCIKCKIQQKKENFWYCSARHETCKYCNKKTNIIPSVFKPTTEQILNQLRKVVFDPKHNISIFFQTQLDVVFEFLQRQSCREREYGFSEENKNQSHKTKQIVQTRSGDKPEVSENRLSGSQQWVKTGDNTLSEERVGCGLAFDERPTGDRAGGKRGKLCCYKHLCPKCQDLNSEETEVKK